MRVVKQIIAQQADILKQPKKKRRCEAECREHQFVIRQIQKGSKNMDISMNFCPKYRRGDLPPENSFAEFNKDGIFYTSAFILGVDKKLSQKIQKEEQIEHIRIVRLACEKNCLVRFPKPNPKHSLCSVCKVTYGNYLKHILSQFHKERVNNCPYNHHIAELSQEFKHLHPPDLSNVSNPFLLALKGQSYPTNRKKQTDLSEDNLTQNIIEVKSNQKHCGNQLAKSLQVIKEKRTKQKKKEKNKRITQKKAPSLTQNESSSSLSSDQSSSSSSDTSSSSSISSESDSKSSFSSDKHRKKNKSSRSSSSSSISTSSLSSSQSSNSLSSKNGFSLNTNNYQLHKKKKEQTIDIAMQRKKKKQQSSKEKKKKKNNIHNDANIRQKAENSVKNNQLFKVKKSQSVKRKRLKDIDPQIKGCKKRKKVDTDKKTMTEQKTIQRIQQINTSINQSENNVVGGNMEKKKSQAALRIETQQNPINQRRQNDVQQILRIPVQIDLPLPRQSDVAKFNRSKTKSICWPQNIKKQLVNSLPANISSSIIEQNIQKEIKVNIPSQQSAIQTIIQNPDPLKDKLESKIIPITLCDLNSEKEEINEKSNQNIGLNLQPMENQKTNWLQDWKRASSLSLQDPLCKKFINNKREIIRQQLIEVDDYDVQDKQIDDEKQTSHQNYSIKRKQNPKNGKNRESSKDFSKLNSRNGRLSLQKLSNFLIEQYAKLKRLSTNSESLPDDVSTYLSNEFRLKND